LPGYSSGDGFAFDWSEPIFPPTRSNALCDSFLGSRAGSLLDSLGRFKAPARSNAGTFAGSLESFVSSVGVVFRARAGAADFWVTLAAWAGDTAGVVFAPGVWADGAGVVDACCFDAFGCRAKRKTTPMIAAKITTAPMARSGQGLKDFGAAA
jgi:hypothetical protein